MIAEAVGKNILAALLCLAFGSNGAKAQTWVLSEKVSRVITGTCPVCASNKGITLAMNPVPASVASDFHVCHTSLEQNDLDKGYEYAVRCLLSLNRKDYPMYISALFLKARVLYLKQSFREALQNYLSLIELKPADTLLYSNIYTNTAEVYLNLSDFNNALKYFEAWRQKFMASSDPGTVAKVYSNMGTCFTHLQRFADADQYFTPSEKMFSRLKDTLALAKLYMNIAARFYEDYRDRQAFGYFKKALYMAQRSRDTLTQKSAYQNMAVISAGKKEYQSAYTYLTKYDELKDSLWNADRVWLLPNQEKKVLAERQKLKDALALEAGKTKDLQIRNEKLTNKVLVALALIFLLVIGFVYIAYRQKSRRNRIIAEQKNELDRLNQTKDQLFSILAHDLRAPVHSLRVHLSSLKSALNRNSVQEATRFSEDIEKISNSTYGLLNNLLHWSLSQTGQLLFFPERLELQLVVEQVIYDYRPVAAPRRIHLESLVQGRLYFMGDLNAIKIILRNLIDNAIKFTPEGGSVTVTAQTTGSMCELTVQDSGTGMDSETIQALQNNETRRIQNDAGGGRSTGLGLWLSKSMAEKNGGSLRVVSVPGKGSSVIVTLPLAI